jgi:putative transposase
MSADVQRGKIPVPNGLQQRWSMDFVHDQLIEGRKFRVLTVVDQWSRQTPTLEARFSFRGKDVVAALERVREHAGLPDSITVDHGTEFMSRAVEAWAFYRGIKLDFTRPGKPTDNSHIESFNGRLRDECLNVHQFLSLHHANQQLAAWRTDYNGTRPHSSLGNLTPSEFAQKGRTKRSEETANF